MRMLKESGEYLLFVHDSRVFDFNRHSEGRKSLKIWLPSYFRNYSALCEQDCNKEKKEQEPRRTEEKKNEKMGSLPVIKTAIFWHQKSV